MNKPAFIFSCMLMLFITEFSAAQKYKIMVVDQSGKGDFTTLGAAIDKLRAYDSTYTIINIREGFYHEKLIIPAHIYKVKLVGDGVDKTIISYTDRADLNNRGTFRSYTLQILGSDISLENLTVENAAEPLSQAVALHTEGDWIQIRNCRLLGNQDTFYAGGENKRLYIVDSYIEGTTDFIFGGATVWFENCVIHCKKDSYITAASTYPNVQYGYIFNNCKITMAEGVNSMYLGRPWRPYAMTVFMNCDLPKQINPAGWENWRNPSNEKTARYAEYNNRGEGSKTSERVKWARMLSKKESRKITRANVLKDFDAQLKLAEK